MPVTKSVMRDQPPGLKVAGFDDAIRPGIRRKFALDPIVELNKLLVLYLVHINAIVKLYHALLRRVRGKPLGRYSVK